MPTQTIESPRRADEYVVPALTIIKPLMIAGLITILLFAVGGMISNGYAALGAIIGLMGSASVLWIRLRIWQKKQVAPAALRLALAMAWKQPVEENCVKLTRFTFGSLGQIGSPRKIVINHPALLTAAPHHSVTAANETFKQRYVVRKFNQSKGRLILGIGAIVATDEDSAQEEAKQKIIQGAKEVFGSDVGVKLRWDTTDNGASLLEAEISKVSGMDLSLRNKRTQMITRMRTRLPVGNFVPDIDEHNDVVRFKRSEPLPTLVTQPAHRASLLKNHQEYKDFEIPLAVGPGGSIAAWKPNRDAHMLIAGGTGGGKTICEHGVIQALTQSGWRVWLADGKRVEFMGYRKWPNVEILAQSIEEQVKVIHMAHDLMERRYNLIRDEKATRADMEPLAVVIDEVTAMLVFARQLYGRTKTKGRGEKAPVLEWLGNIARLGRTAKIHLVLGIQRPDADILGGELRANLGCRISMGRLDSKEFSLMVWGNAAIGCQLPQIKGRAVALIDGQPTQVQAAYTTNPYPGEDDYHAGMVAAAKPTIEIYSRKMIQPVEPEISDEGDEQEITWEDIIDAPIKDAAGKLVTIPAYGGEESAVREKIAASLAPTEYKLQVLASFEEIDTIFDPINQLASGHDLALTLRGWAQADAPPQGPVRTKIEPIKNSYVDLSTPVEYGTMRVDNMSEGAYIVIPELGEEIMLSDIDVDDENPGSYLIGGYTENGERYETVLDGDLELDCREGVSQSDEKYFENAA